ncbi:MAG: diguanylate cyclase [Rhodocyclaceae bacterium]|nr:diguanylate cyclase [Rhodocyclaceae bacterium]
MRLRNKILLGYVVIAVVALLAAAVGHRAIESAQHELDGVVRRTRPVMDALELLRREVVRATYGTLHAVRVASAEGSSPPPLDDAALREAFSEYVEAVDRYFPDERAVAARIRQAVDDLATDLRAHDAAASDPDSSRAVRGYERRALQQLVRLEALIGDALKGENEELESHLADVDASARDLTLQTILLAGVLLMLVTGGGVWLSRSLTRPLDRLRDAAERMARGEYDIHLDPAGHDDLADLGMAFQRLSHELIDTVVSRDDVEAIVDAISDGLLVIGPDGIIQRANAAMRLKCADVVDGPLAGMAVTDILECTSKEQHFSDSHFTRVGYECLLLPRTAHQRRVSVSATSIRADRSGSGRVLLVRDLDHDHDHTAPTVKRGRVLPSPEALCEHLATRLSVLEWRGRFVGVLMIGVDHGRELMHTLGIAEGGEIMQALAHRFGSALRPDDAVAIWTDESIAVVLEDIGSPADLPKVAESVLAALERPIELGQHRVQLRVSIGMAVAPEHGERVDHLMSCAESAMRCTMADGKRRYMLFAHGAGKRPRGEAGQA